MPARTDPSLDQWELISPRGISHFTICWNRNTINCIPAPICVCSLAGNDGLEGGGVGEERRLGPLRPGRVLHHQEARPGGAPQMTFDQISSEQFEHLVRD